MVSHSKSVRRRSIVWRAIYRCRREVVSLFRVDALVWAEVILEQRRMPTPVGTQIQHRLESMKFA